MAILLSGKNSHALALDPNDIRSYNRRGVAYKKNGQYSRAVKDYTEAIRLDPNDAAFYSNYSWLLASCIDNTYRNGRLAVNLGIKANQLENWRQADYIDTLAPAYAETGHFDRAIEYQQQAIAMIGPDDKERLRMYQQRLSLYKTDRPVFSI